MRIVQFSRSLRGRHSTAIRRSSANALSPLHQVTVYAWPQHVRYSTVSRSRLHRCSVVIPSPLDCDPTVYFSMLGHVMIFSNVYNVFFNRLKAFLDCSVFTFHHSDDYKMFQNLFTQCHGPSLDDDKAPAIGHGSSLDNKAPVTTLAATPAATPATTSIAKLPTVAIGKHDLSFESHSIQDLDSLVDVELLWDVRGEGAETRQRERG